MRRGPTPRQNTREVMRSARATPIATGAAASGTKSRRRRSAPSQPMPSACTTCTATSFNGSRIAGMPTTRADPSPRRQEQSVIAKCEYVAAVPFPTIRGSFAPPSASGTPPATIGGTSGSVLPGRLPPESLPLYLVATGGTPGSGEEACGDRGGKGRSARRLPFGETHHCGQHAASIVATGHFPVWVKTFRHHA